MSVSGPAALTRVELMIEKKNPSKNNRQSNSTPPNYSTAHCGGVCGYK